MVRREEVFYSFSFSPISNYLWSGRNILWEGSHTFFIALVADFGETHKVDS
jgi:hypothetical protein